MVMNSQVHLKLKTSEFEKLKKEAKKCNLSRSELIRRKLPSPPVEEEIILLRQLKEVILKKSEKIY